MLIRLTRKAIATLEFRGVLVMLALVGATLLYFALFHGHRPPPDDLAVPTVPAGEQPPPSRL